jgi:hypothetical protein
MRVVRASHEDRDAFRLTLIACLKSKLNMIRMQWASFTHFMKFVKSSCYKSNDENKYKPGWDFTKKRQAYFIMFRQVTEFLNNRINQCHKCQKFEHLISTCKSTHPTCKWCAEKHDSRMHTCIICNAKESCSHISSKCANCEESHTSIDSKSEHFRAIQIRARKSTNILTHE